MPKSRLLALSIVVLVFLTLTSCAEPTATQIPGSDWCYIRNKYYEARLEDSIFTEALNNTFAEGPIRSSDWETWRITYVASREKICNLPRTPVDARRIADKLCSCAEARTAYLEAKPSDRNSLRAQADLCIIEARDMVADLNTQYGNPSCE